MKRMVSLCLLCVMALGLCACGQKEETSVLDDAALAGELLESGAFSQELEELSAGKAEAFYSVAEDKLQSARMYHAAGTSKEQIAIFQATDEEAAKTMASGLRDLLAEWIEADRNYAPEEVPKMEKAVLRQSGVWVILVVANDSEAAAGIVDQHL